MNILVVCAGNTLKDYERAWIDEYEKRSKRFGRLDVIRIKEKDTPTSTWKEFQKSLPKNSYVLLLDPKGKLFSTEDLTQQFLKAEKNFKGNLTFIIGGSNGLPDEARNEVQLLSLTPLTLPHRLALLVLMEQIYRVLTIRAGTPYNK